MNSWKLILLGILVIAIAYIGFQLNARNLQVEPVDEDAKAMYQVAQQLIPLHQSMGPIQSGDWLGSHREPGQSFGAYSRTRHIRLTDERNVLYVLPLGEFNEKQMKVVELSADFLSRYFMCEVKTMETMGLDVIPSKARRVNPNQGMRQIHSKFVLDELLPPMLPEDGVAMIAFTSSDLYPEDSWNFVYGQASLAQRVGVWSLFRNGDPETEFTTVLRRTLKTATHETGHMFSIRHCIAYECNMCGSNNRSESDRHPLPLCPECVAKVWWSTDCDPIERFRKLATFCQQHGLDSEATHYRNSIEAISK